jgi:hypothetical protein
MLIHMLHRLGVREAPLRGEAVDCDWLLSTHSFIAAF